MAEAGVAGDQVVGNPVRRQAASVSRVAQKVSTSLSDKDLT